MRVRQDRGRRAAEGDEALRPVAQIDALAVGLIDEAVGFRPAIDVDVHKLSDGASPRRQDLDQRLKLAIKSPDGKGIRGGPGF